MCQRSTLRGRGGGRGSGVRDMDPPRWEIYMKELSSLKRHSLILRPILCTSNAIFRQQFKKFDFNNSTSVSNVLFPEMCSP